MLPSFKLCSRILFHSDGSGTVSGIFHTEICSYHLAGIVPYRGRSLYNFKKIRGGIFREGCGCKGSEVFKRNIKKHLQNKRG